MLAPQFNFVDFEPAAQSFKDATLDGFQRSPKSLPCQYLYDEAGSALFDKICALPEYYLTRVETQILQENARVIADHIGAKAQIIELGSGSNRKVKVLLDSLVAPVGYVPVDVSREHLHRASRDLAARHPHIPVTAICADYNAAAWLEDAVFPRRAKRVAFFPGSSIGNYEPRKALTLLRHIRSIVGQGGGLLIGVDLKKPASILNAAYNDSAGVTALFTLNILDRINRELAGDFVKSRFRHLAFYNEGLGRIEIYIESRVDQVVHIAGREFRLSAAERIHTEYSYKYTVAEFQKLAQDAGFDVIETLTDSENLFSVHYLRAQ